MTITIRNPLTSHRVRNGVLAVLLAALATMAVVIAIQAMSDSQAPIATQSNGYRFDVQEFASLTPSELTAGYSRAPIAAQQPGYRVAVGEFASLTPAELAAGFSRAPIGTDVQEFASLTPAELAAGYSRAPIVTEFP